MRVIGIDSSLTSTGVAVIDELVSGRLHVTTHRIETSPPKRAKGDKTPPTLAERHTRLRTVKHLGLTSATRFLADLAVIEGPSYSSAGAGTWDRAGAWWLVVDWLLTADIPVAVVPPKTRALWATGSGAASKSPVAVHMSRLWPDLDLGISDDEWDAVALASMGAQRLGVVPVELARHREQLAKVSWPDIPAVVSA